MFYFRCIFFLDVLNVPLEIWVANMGILMLFGLFGLDTIRRTEIC